jgi:hypothetical protein
MMPSTSKKQHNLMALVANNPAAAKRLKIPQSVGAEFMSADKGKKFKEGGVAMKKTMESGKSDTAQDKAMIKKAFKQHDMQEHKGGAGTKLKLKKGGMTMAACEKSGKDVEKKGVKEGSKADMAMDKKQMMGMKKGGMMKYAKGGMITTPMGSVTSGGKRPHGEHTIQTKGHTKGTNIKMRGA